MSSFGENPGLDRLVSQVILKHLQVSMPALLTIMVLTLVCITVYVVRSKRRQYFCLYLAPALALCLLYGQQHYYINRLTHGTVLYEFVECTNGMTVDADGYEVSANITHYKDGEVYLITNTKYSPQLLTPEEAQLYAERK